MWINNTDGVDVDVDVIVGVDVVVDADADVIVDVDVVVDTTLDSTGECIVERGRSLVRCVDLNNADVVDVDILFKVC